MLVPELPSRVHAARGAPCPTPVLVCTVCSVFSALGHERVLLVLRVCMRRGRRKLWDCNPAGESRGDLLENDTSAAAHGGRALHRERSLDRRKAGVLYRHVALQVHPDKLPKRCDGSNSKPLLAMMRDILAIRAVIG